MWQYLSKTFNFYLLFLAVLFKKFNHSWNPEGWTGRDEHIFFLGFFRSVCHFQKSFKLLNVLWQWLSLFWLWQKHGNTWKKHFLSYIKRQCYSSIGRVCRTNSELLQAKTVILLDTKKTEMPSFEKSENCKNLTDILPQFSFQGWLSPSLWRRHIIFGCSEPRVEMKLCHLEP